MHTIKSLQLISVIYNASFANIATCMITAPVVGAQYDNPYEWQRDVLIVAQQQVDCSR